MARTKNNSSARTASQPEKTAKKQKPIKEKSKGKESVATDSVKRRPGRPRKNPNPPPDTSSDTIRKKTTASHSSSSQLKPTIRIPGKKKQGPPDHADQDEPRASQPHDGSSDAITPPPEIPQEMLEAHAAETLMSLGLSRHRRFSANTDGSGDLDETDSADSVWEVRREARARFGNQHESEDDSEEVELVEDDEESDGSDRPVGKDRENEDEDDESEEEDQDPPVNIKFLIPVGEGVNDSIVLPSDTTYKKFTNEVSNVLNIASKNVHMAYRLSTRPASDKSFEIIKDRDQFLELLESAKREIAAMNKGKGKTKEFSVQLKDMSMSAGTGGGGSSKKGITKEEKAKS
ncbi:hypothetical protein PM082_015673 [Marasmius tenuissimus]|nr:hypothetical protein PM082_015673 [Marasmius tenuissimus]